MKDYDFIFLDYQGIPYKCSSIGSQYWISALDKNKQWHPVRKIKKDDIWLYPHNLTEEQQQYYNSLGDKK